MRPHRRTTPLRTLSALLALLAFAAAAAAQTPQPACKIEATPTPTPSPMPAPQPSGLRIVVTGPDGQPVKLKRFYLLTKDVTQKENSIPDEPPTRAKFLEQLTRANASKELVEWLGDKAHDCDSLYCPEYKAKFKAAVEKGNIKEFAQAYRRGLEKYGDDPKLALEWLTVNFPLKSARLDFYNSRKSWLEKAARAGGGVASIMTDEKGVAYFTDVKPGAYYVSNLLPLEHKDGNVLWNCQVNVPQPIPRQHYAVSYALSAPKSAPK